MQAPHDEYDDAFIIYISDLVERVAGLGRALEYIHVNLGRVCEEFEICTHSSCADAMASWMIASNALKGDYSLPGDEVQPRP